MRVTARYAQRYFAPDAYVGNRDELARRRNNGTEGETGGGGKELSNHRSKKVRRCIFVRRCVIRVITLTSLLPKEKRGRGGNKKIL